VEITLVASDGGIEQRATTDSVGIATLRISRPGAWTVRYLDREGDGQDQRQAELSFTVPPASFWQQSQVED
jgi:hypothetical protein